MAATLLVKLRQTGLSHCPHRFTGGIRNQVNHQKPLPKGTSTA
jgi:hypothetical protein